MSNNGLWRIESVTFNRGGDLEYYVPYRIRHLISG